MRLPPISRRWLIAGGIGARPPARRSSIGLGIIYPRVGAWMIRTRSATRSPRVPAARSRSARSTSRSATRCCTTSRSAARSTARCRSSTSIASTSTSTRWSRWSARSCSGAASIDGVIVTVRRDADGNDNLRDLLERKSRGGQRAAARRTRPTKITVTHGKARRGRSDDRRRPRWSPTATRPGRPTSSSRTRAASPRPRTAAPKAAIASIEVRKAAGAAPIVTIDGGELVAVAEAVAVRHRRQDRRRPGSPGPLRDRSRRRLRRRAGQAVDREGRARARRDDGVARSRGREVPARPARADPRALGGRRLRRRPASTRRFTSTPTQTGAQFSGEFHLRGLNVGHPYIAEKEVHDLDLVGADRRQLRPRDAHARADEGRLRRAQPAVLDHRQRRCARRTTIDETQLDAARRRQPRQKARAGAARPQAARCAS